MVALNIASFANHPASGGMPASDMKNIDSRTARPGAQRYMPDQSANSYDFDARTDGNDHPERAEVHHGVDEQVGDGGGKRLAQVGTGSRRGAERGEHEPRLGDRRVAEQADDVGLLDGDEVPDRHRKHSKYPEQRTPDLRLVGEGQVGNGEHPTNPAPFDPTDNHAVTGVGEPS